MPQINESSDAPSNQLSEALLCACRRHGGRGAAIADAILEEGNSGLRHRLGVIESVAP